MKYKFKVKDQIKFVVDHELVVVNVWVYTDNPDVKKENIYKDYLEKLIKYTEWNLDLVKIEHEEKKERT